MERAANPFAQGIVSAALDQSMNDWTDDIRKGRDGNICKWELTSSNETSVRVKRPSGAMSTVTFEKQGDGWKLIAYAADDADPAASAKVASAVAAAVPTSAPVAPASASIVDEEEEESAADPVAAERAGLESLIAFMKAVTARAKGTPKGPDREPWEMHDLRNYDPTNDPDKLAGRPGQYVVKASFKLLGASAEVEFFPTTKGAIDRGFVARAVAEGDYVYVNEKHKAVLRLPKDLAPAQAKEWETLFSSL